MGVEPAELEPLFLALGDKTRLRLLGLMADGEVSVGFLCDALGDSQPKVSRHLAYLRNASVVTARRDGKHIYYALTEYDDARIAAVLECSLSALSDEPTTKSKPARQARPSPTRSRPPKPVMHYEVEEELEEVESVSAEPEFELEYESESAEEYQPEPAYYPATSEPSEEMDVFLL